MNNFKRGELIEVSEDKDFSLSYIRIFVAYIEGACNPFYCVAKEYEDKFKEDNLFLVCGWKYGRKIRPDLKVDDPVIVWNNINDKFKRHFKAWADDGKIVCFNNGKTLWSNSGDCTPWKYYLIPESEDR